MSSLCLQNLYHIFYPNKNTYLIPFSLYTFLIVLLITSVLIVLGKNTLKRNDFKFEVETAS